MLTFRTGVCLVLLIGIVPGCVLTDGTPSEIASADRLVRQHARDLATGRFTEQTHPSPASDPMPRLTMRPRSTSGGSAEVLRQVALMQNEPLQGQKPPAREPLRIPPGLPG